MKIRTLLVLSLIVLGLTVGCSLFFDHWANTVLDVLNYACAAYCFYLIGGSRMSQVMRHRVADISNAVTKTKYADRVKKAFKKR